MAAREDRVGLRESDNFTRIEPCMYIVYISNTIIVVGSVRAWLCRVFRFSLKVHPIGLYGELEGWICTEYALRLPSDFHLALKVP